MHISGWTAWLFVLIGLAAPLTAADDLTAEAVQQLLDEQPPSRENWPQWRDYYVRLYHDYGIGEPEEFYQRLGAFVAEDADEHNGMLTGAWHDDPVAWIVWSRHLMRTAPLAPERAVGAARRALELGDPVAMSSSNLAYALISQVAVRRDPAGLSPEHRDTLAEAERLLDVVERVVPTARLSYWRGLALSFRGDLPAALPLLRQGALDSKVSSEPAVHYLSLVLSWPDAKPPFAETSELLVQQFPQDARLLALHAVALYRDERFVDAANTLEQAGKLDEQALAVLDQPTRDVIEEGRWLTPLVLEGSKLLEEGLPQRAAENFRHALDAGEQNELAARLLSQALLHPTNMRTANVANVVRECEALCERFPQTAELHVAHAAALFQHGRHVEAKAAVERARAMGIDADKLLGPNGARSIEAAAQRQVGQRFGLIVVASSVGMFSLWTAAMFALGAVLAICTPRTPSPQVIDGDAMSFGEVWLQRFYLLVLTLSLVVFYVSVPFVVLGLLAITLLLFGVLLALRILHLGILQRGYYAICGVLRSLYLGPSSQVLGLVAAPETHPRLFNVLNEVADRLMTRPVDILYLTPSSLIGVREEGKGPFGLFRRKRILELGVSSLSVLTAAEFKSVLAHEYAHFSHRDAFYTRFITQVTGSLGYSLAVMNAAAGILSYVNPFYWLYWFFLHAYALLATGFSRSREFLADRRAVLAYGREPFVSGLGKVMVDGHLFEGSAFHNVRHELSAGRAFVNVFDAFRAYRDHPEHAGAHAAAYEALQRAKPGWFDSHPTYVERVAAVNGFASAVAPPDPRPATELLSNFTDIEEQLTALLTGFIRDNFDIVDTRQWAEDDTAQQPS